MIRASRIMTLVTACFAMLTFAAAELEPAIALIGIPAGIIAWALRQRSNRSVVPRMFINLIIFALVGYAVRDAWLNAITVSQVGLLIISLLIVKLFDRASSRDESQVLMLSVFLVIGSMLQSVGLVVGLMSLLFIPTGVVAIMLHQMAAGSEAAAVSMKTPSHARRAFTTPDPALGTRSWRHFARLCTGAVTVIVCIGVAVFVLFPRGIGANMFGTIGNAAQQSTGFSDDVDLIGLSGISQSDQVVMSVQMLDERGTNIGREGQAHYLRGAILTQYANGKWTGEPSGTGEIVLRTNKPETTTAPLSIGLGSRIRQTVQLFGPASHNTYIFALYRPSLLTLKEPREVRYSETSGRLIAFNLGHSASYTVESFVPSVTHDSELFDFARRPELGFERSLAHVRAMEVLDRAALDADLAWRSPAQRVAAATAVRNYLRTSFNYSLIPPTIYDGTDPIDWFLENGTEAHCEFFASCMTAMCRSLGIPARMVTGYVAAEWNGASKSYTVRASNAHAWVEVLGAEGEWVTMDPTPPADFVRLHQPPPSMFRNLRQLLDSINRFWVMSVMSFGERGTATENQGQWFQRIAEEVEAQEYQSGRSLLNVMLRWLTPFILGVALLVLALQIYRGRSWRSVFGLFGQADPYAGLLPAYPKLLRVLAKRRVPKPMWRSPMDHANAIRHLDPAAASALDVISQMYYGIRFGNRTIDVEDVRRAGEIVKQLAASPAIHQ
ncbi:MAG: DUF3488 domain-containing protein [Phycisphaeraceae bacterium]|nr:DUF3488 domain-containing protein [Phycisphaerales bacterium]MCB9860128.1 DUF3488 domain-containing protein [Phycisphaeraceae bacterium]